MTDKQIEAALKVCEARKPEGTWFYSDILDNDTGGVVTEDNGILIGTGKAGPHSGYHWHAAFTQYVAATTDPDTGYEAALREVQRLRAVLQWTHDTYCCEAFTGRGLHSPECLLYQDEP